MLKLTYHKLNGFRLITSWIELRNGMSVVGDFSSEEAYDFISEWERSGKELSPREYYLAKELLQIPNKMDRSKWKWSPEKIKLESAKYGTAKEWKLASPSSYNAALDISLSFYRECTKHMTSKQRHWRYWDLERCKKSALQFKTRSEWQKGQVSAYIVARKNSWLDQCCAHMEQKRVPNGYWNLEKCKEIALNYFSSTDWLISHPASYSYAVQKKWLKECCTHMIPPQKPSGYWTLERCKESALKYSTRSEWRQAELGAISAAYDNKWIDQCCGHMIKKRRNYWTPERCKKSALQFKTRSEWQKKDNCAFYASFRLGVYLECTKHMELLKIHEKKPKILFNENVEFWTFDKISKVAVKFNDRHLFRVNYPDAWAVAKANGWTEELIKSMKEPKKSYGYWSESRLTFIASLYSTREEWRQQDPLSYERAMQKKFLNKLKPKTKTI